MQHLICAVTMTINGSEVSGPKDKRPHLIPSVNCKKITLSSYFCFGVPDFPDFAKKGEMDVGHCGKHVLLSRRHVSSFTKNIPLLAFYVTA